MFYQCKLPITSCGIILFRTTPTVPVQYLMIRRKDSFGYIDFLRGKYSLYHLDKIKQLLAEMSTEEQSRLLQRTFSELWVQLWGNSSTNVQHCFEETSSEKKFNQLVQGYRLHGEWIQLRNLVEQAPHAWTETEWEFPKGRRIVHETDLDCALREFEEETGISANSISVVENVLPFEEIFVGSNYKAYKHKYFLAKCLPFTTDTDTNTNMGMDMHSQRATNNSTTKDENTNANAVVDAVTLDRNEHGENENENENVNLTHYQKAEVSAMEWKTYEECMSLIRPYHTEKKKMVQRVHNLITTHWVSDDDEFH